MYHKITISLLSLTLFACNKHDVPEIANLGEVQQKIVSESFLQDAVDGKEDVKQVKLAVNGDSITAQSYFDAYCKGNNATAVNCQEVFKLIALQDKIKTNIAAYKHNEEVRKHDHEERMKVGKAMRSHFK